MSNKRIMSIKDTRYSSAHVRNDNVERNELKSPTFSNVVLLTLNLRKSPWLLSRCKKTFQQVQNIQKLVKDLDNLKVVVKLVKAPFASIDDEKYLALVSTLYDQKEEVNFLLGINVMKNRATVGLVIPICMETDISLNGDGGFFVFNSEKKYSFQPVSIQEMWSALQALVRCTFNARSKNRHQVVTDYYEQLPKSEPHQVCDWERIDDVLSSKQSNILSCCSKEKSQLKTMVQRKLQEMLVTMDLDTVTCKEIRDALEEKLKMNVQEKLELSLSQYKQFIDEETIFVMRQMDSPSQILDFLYLGSEWNASNFEELKRNKVGYILNVTKEIENFFPGMFKYCNVRVYDYEETELLKYWNSTFKFISEAKKKDSNVLVHCKMGISRSASTVIAFVMKYCEWSVEQAYQFVKQKRSCIQPNPGFMQQLITYQGILDASNHRHSKLFRSRSIGSVDKVKKDQVPVKNVRPKSDAENKFKDAEDKEVQLLLESEVPDPNESSFDKFVIVEANEEYINASVSSCMGEESHVEIPTFIDESTLSSSSVLRQWSIHSSTFFSTERKEKSNFEDIDELLDSSTDNFRIRSNSCPEDINSCHFSTAQVSPQKRFVKIGIPTKKQYKIKRCSLRRHHSMFQE